MRKAAEIILLIITADQILLTSTAAQVNAPKHAFNAAENVFYQVMNGAPPNSLVSTAPTG
jgi:hypothetical protein